MKNKSNKLKVGNNILVNRFSCLNKQIPLMLLNLLYEDLNVESFAYDGNARSNLNVGTKAF